MMPIVFEPEAREDYMYWQQNDKVIAKRINQNKSHCKRTL